MANAKFAKLNRLTLKLLKLKQLKLNLLNALKLNVLNLNLLKLNWLKLNLSKLHSLKLKLMNLNHANVQLGSCWDNFEFVFWQYVVCFVEMFSHKRRECLPPLACASKRVLTQASRVGVRHVPKLWYQQVMKIEKKIVDELSLKHITTTLKTGWAGRGSVWIKQ